MMADLQVMRSFLLMANWEGPDLGLICLLKFWLAQAWGLQEAVRILVQGLKQPAKCHAWVDRKGVMIRTGHGLPPDTGHIS